MPTPADVRRLFAATPAEHQVLTVNGLIYDWIHYRHNPDAVAEVIDNQHRFTPFSERLEEDGKVIVPIRTWEFDLDMIEILDTVTGKYHKMWSTDPDYTGGLSRWEHKLYRSYLDADGRGGKRQRGRIRTKAKSERLHTFDDELYKMGMRERAAPIAALEAEERRQGRLNGSASV